MPAHWINCLWNIASVKVFPVSRIAGKAGVRESHSAKSGNADAHPHDDLISPDRHGLAAHDDGGAGSVQ